MHQPSFKPSIPLKPLNKPTRGRVYPPPTPSQTGRPAHLFARLAYAGPSWTSKKHCKNVYFLFMGPFGADHDPLKPPTTHIIPAIQRLYAQNDPKVTPKWTQSHPHMPKEIPKQPQTHLKFTPYFYKIITTCFHSN